MILYKKESFKVLNSKFDLSPQEKKKLAFYIALKKILSLEFVDITRTKTNDINEIFAVLGIEAARQAIINEVSSVIESQGLNVDIRHLMLIADTMTTTGKVKGITD